MADISFYKYLEAAFRYRLFNPAGQRASLQTKFNALGYNLPYERIFYYARKLLPKFYTDTSRFPDTEAGNLQMAKNVLEKLDKHQDTQLENQLKAVTVSKENAQIIAEAQAQSQQAEAGLTQVPADTATGSAGGISMPSAPSISSGPRRIYNIPQAPSEPQTPQPKIEIANKSGVIQEAPSGSKLVTANSSGALKGLGEEAPTKQIFIANKSGAVTGMHNIKSPSWLKTFGSNAQIFAKKNLGRIGRSLAEIAGGVGRGIAGPSLTGTYNLLGKAANGGLNAFERLSNPALRGASRSFVSSGSKKMAWGLVGVLIFFVLFSGLIGGLPGTVPTGGAAPIAPISTDISSCKFTRGQENPKEASFKSNALLGYIQEASQKSSIPPAVLAAFIRVESPASSNMSDDQIANYSANCEQSPTGALGIMQIQPPNTTSARGDPASCDDCIDAGAKLVGKTVSTMTRQDYCDPRTNIIVGAGWILKKMSKLGYGDGTKWDPGWTNNRTAIEALVNTYYGCLQYGGTTDCTGPFNYADDVSTSIQNCKPITSTKEFALSCPINNESNTCSHSGDPRDNCHCNPSQYLSMDACRTDASLYFGIDVGTKASKTALIPYITYQGETTPQTLTCQLITAQSATCPAPGCEPQQILHYHCTTNKVDLYLQYNHIKASSSFPTTISSGQAVGDVANYGDGLRRLNIQVGVGGECAYGQTQYCKSGGDYFQCPLQKESAPDY